MRSSNTKPKRPRDANQLAYQIVQESTGQAPAAPPLALVAEAGKNPAAVALGRLGGLKGGRARAESMTAEQRSEIAKKAADARWHKDG
jgi:hypothetical protein